MTVADLLSRFRTRTKRPVKKRRQRSLFMEPLEDRRLLAAITDMSGFSGSETVVDFSEAGLTPFIGTRVTNQFASLGVTFSDVESSGVGGFTFTGQSGSFYANLDDNNLTNFAGGVACPGPRSIHFTSDASIAGFHIVTNGPDSAKLTARDGGVDLESHVFNTSLTTRFIGIQNTGGFDELVLEIIPDSGSSGSNRCMIMDNLHFEGNNAPEADDDAYSTDEDTPLVVAAPGVLSNDSDADGDTLTATVATGPTNGTLVLNGDGSFNYTPDLNFNGTDTFTYTADDGNGGTDTATVTITVNSVIDAVIDVKPGNGDDVDPINLGSNGRTPIAILTTSVAAGEIDDFDATTVDTSTIKINGAAISPDKVKFEDVDGDGDLDLLLHFLTQDLANILVPEDVLLELTAEVDGGDAIGPDLAGSDDIKIVPGGKGKGKNK